MTYDFTTVTEVRLGTGSHSTPRDGMCFMEMVAWFANEEHTDQPACACPILGGYGMRLNDAMPGDLRDELLKPLIPMIAGTAGSYDDRLKRGQFLAMWSVTKVLPIALRAIGLEDHANACAAAADLSAAYAAADAAADAARAAADAARREVFTIAVEGLRQAIMIGPHAGFDQLIDIAMRHAALRELVAA